MRKLFLTFVALVVGSFTAMAQSTVGLEARAGLNISKLYFVDDYDFENNANSGVNAGLLLTVDFPKGVGFETGLVFSVKGNSSEVETNNRTDEHYYTRSYLELPVHFRYRVPIDDKVTFVARVGTYYAVGVYGRDKEEITIKDPNGSEHQTTKNHKMTIGTGSNAGFRPFDVGLQAGLGVEVGRFTGSAQFSYGFLNVLPKDTYGNTHNMTLSFIVGIKIF
jgi:hypothetical protein